MSLWEGDANEQRLRGPPLPWDGLPTVWFKFSPFLAPSGGAGGCLQNTAVAICTNSAGTASRPPALLPFLNLTSPRGDRAPPTRPRCFHLSRGEGQNGACLSGL